LVNLGDPEKTGGVFGERDRGAGRDVGGFRRRRGNAQSARGKFVENRGAHGRNIAGAERRAIADFDLQARPRGKTGRQAARKIPRRRGELVRVTTSGVRAHRKNSQKENCQC
jgi:hypothetical protein